MTIHPSSHPSMPHVPHGFGPNALIAIIGGAVLISALVAAGLWTSTQNDSSSPVAPAASESGVHQPNYPASREGVRGHVDVDDVLGGMVVSSETQPVTHQPNYPASREGVRGHIDVEDVLAISSGSQAISHQPNYPASREGARGHVDVDDVLGGMAVNSETQPVTHEPNYPASREGVRGPVDVAGN